MTIAVYITRLIDLPDADYVALMELVREERAAHPPVADSIALQPWTCAHGKVYEDHYMMEIVCGLLHPSTAESFSYSFTHIE